MKRKLLREAPSNDQVKKFAGVLKLLFGDDCQMGFKQGHGDAGIIFYSHRDDNFKKVRVPSGQIEDLGPTRPRMFDPLLQGAESISYGLLQNAEQIPAFLNSIKSLFRAAGRESEFDDKFATAEKVPLTLDEREELARLRKENEELKKKIAELQGKAYGIPRGPAAVSAPSKYGDLEID